MDEINPLSKFLSPLIFFICGKDTISVPGIVCGTIWGSFPVLGSFAVQFGDHLRYWDHLRAGIICGAVQSFTKRRILCVLWSSVVGLLLEQFRLLNPKTAIKTSSREFLLFVRKKKKHFFRKAKYIVFGRIKFCHIKTDSAQSSSNKCK